MVSLSLLLISYNLPPSWKFFLIPARLGTGTLSPITRHWACQRITSPCLGAALSHPWEAWLSLCPQCSQSCCNHCCCATFDTPLLAPLQSLPCVEAKTSFHQTRGSGHDEVVPCLHNDIVVS